MVLPDDPARAHVLDRRVDVNHEVLARLGVNKLLRVPENFLVRPCWRAHGLGPTLHGSRRVLRSRKPTFAHAKGLVLDVDAEIVAGLGVALGRRVDPAFSQERLEADLLDRDAAECSACGLPQTQIPNPDAVTSTRYSLQAGVFSSGVVKLDGGDGGGGALSLPGVRGDAPSCSLELVQPMAVPSFRGCLCFVGLPCGGCLCVAALGGVKRGAFRPALFPPLLAFQGRPLSAWWGTRGALFARGRSGGTGRGGGKGPERNVL